MWNADELPARSISIKRFVVSRWHVCGGRGPMGIQSSVGVLCLAESPNWGRKGRAKELRKGKFFYDRDKFLPPAGPLRKAGRANWYVQPSTHFRMRKSENRALER